MSASPRRVARAWPAARAGPRAAISARASARAVRPVRTRAASSRGIVGAPTIWAARAPHHSRRAAALCGPSAAARRSSSARPPGEAASAGDPWRRRRAQARQLVVGAGAFEERSGGLGFGEALGVAGDAQVGEHPARVGLGASIAAVARAAERLVGQTRRLVRGARGGPGGGAGEEGARREGGAAEVLPEQRGAAGGGDGRAEIAEVGGGGGLACAVAGLLDDGAGAHRVIDRGGVRGEGALGITSMERVAPGGGEARALLGAARERLAAGDLRERFARLALGGGQQRGHLAERRAVRALDHARRGGQVAAIEREPAGDGAGAAVEIVSLVDGAARPALGEIEIAAAAEHLRAQRAEVGEGVGLRGEAEDQAARAAKLAAEAEDVGRGQEEDRGRVGAVLDREDRERVRRDAADREGEARGLGGIEGREGRVVGDRWSSNHLPRALRGGLHLGERPGRGGARAGQRDQGRGERGLRDGGDAGEGPGRRGAAHQGGEPAGALIEGERAERLRGRRDRRGAGEGARARGLLDRPGEPGRDVGGDGGRRGELVATQAQVAGPHEAHVPIGAIMRGALAGDLRHPPGRGAGGGARREERGAERVDRGGEAGRAGRAQRIGGGSDRGIAELGEDQAEGQEIAGAGVAEIAIAEREVAERGALGRCGDRGAGEAEVEDVHRAARVEEEVVRLDVAVGEAERVEIGERLADVARDGEGELGAMRAGRTIERRALDPAQREEGARLRRRRGRRGGREAMTVEEAPAQVEQLGEARGERERGVKGLARERGRAAGAVGDLERDDDPITVAASVKHVRGAAGAGPPKDRVPRCQPM